MEGKYNILEKNSKKIKIFKFKREDIKEPKILNIRKLNVPNEIDKIMSLQEEVFSKLIEKNKCGFVANRTKEMYLSSKKVIFGIFDGKELIGQASLCLEKVDKFPRNKKVAEILGENGYEMGAVMVKSEYAGNRLCEKMIEFGSNLVKEKKGDFILYNVQYTNFSSIVPALKQENSFIGECSKASVDEYFKSCGQEPCKEQKGLIIEDVSIFIPLKNQNIELILNFKENSLQESLLPDSFLAIEDFIKNNYIFSIDKEKKVILAREISNFRKKSKIFGKHTKQLLTKTGSGLSSYL